MDLICYLHEGWRPLIRPASAKRDWMDKAPESFAYRCLPLNIANSHGWELLNPCAFDACWNGHADVGAVTIRPQGNGPVASAATSLFGQGIVTFHIPGIFRTPPGWNLWVGGSPNQPKDGIYPLTGVVETDWSPFTFTMNWRFTRPNHWIRFEAGEAICFLFPLQRAALEEVKPVFAPIEAEPDLLGRFQAWSKGRNEFVDRVSKAPPKTAADKWQKHYYRGVDMSEKEAVGDHRTKLRIKPFDESAISWPTEVATPIAVNVGQETVVPVTAPVPKQAPVSEQGPNSRTLLDLRKREWLLQTLERTRGLAPHGAEIERRAGLGSEEFLERYYAANRPVILTGEMFEWPALAKWTPEYLSKSVGSKTIEFQGDRNKNGQFEIHKDAHRREMPFDRFIDLLLRPGNGNDAYLTAYNSVRNSEALRPLHADMGFPDKYLTREVEQPNGMMWIGPAGTLTSLHHDLTNNLIAQVVGRKRLLVLPASEVSRLYNHLHVFSEIADLEGPGLTVSRFPRLAGLRYTVVTLMPGEMIFMPLAWWHQVRSIDFSVTVTYTNFRWPNDGYRDFPTS